MLSIAEDTTKVQALYQRIEQLEADNAASHAREWQAIEGERLAIEREERSSARAEQYRQELQYQNAVIAVPSTSLGASQKLTMIAARRFVRELRVDPYVETVIHLSSIGETIGMSPDTVRDNLKYFTKHLPDVLEYRFDREKLKDEFGRTLIGADNKPVFRSTSYITLKPLIEFPQEIVADAPRKQGGARKCKVCGSEDLEVVKRVRCRHCNNIEWEWPADSDMGAAPPEQETLDVVPTPEIVEVSTEVSTASQEATASVTVVEAPIVHSEIEPDKNASESVIVAVMERYGVKHLPYMTCHCGSKLFHMVLGDWCCARCEPGNLWPDNYVQAIKAIYPALRWLEVR